MYSPLRVALEGINFLGTEFKEGALILFISFFFHTRLLNYLSEMEESESFKRIIFVLLNFFFFSATPNFFSFNYTTNRNRCFLSTNCILTPSIKQKISHYQFHTVYLQKFYFRTHVFYQTNFILTYYLKNKNGGFYMKFCFSE